MNRTAFKIFSLLLLLVSASIALFPTLASRTHLVDSATDFNWQIGSIILLEMHHDVAGQAFASAWTGTWGVAIAAEMLLLGLYFFKPIRKSRYVVGINQ